jgi:hypothetical protein
MLLAVSSLALGATPGVWKPAADSPTKRMEGSMASLQDERIAYVGGTYMGSAAGRAVYDPARKSALGGQPFSSGAVYDPAKNSWAVIPDMLTPRDAPGTCVMSSPGGSMNLYAFGGTVAYPTSNTTVANITSSVESIVIGPSGQTWSFQPSLPSARTSPSVTRLGDSSGCVVAGGFSSNTTGFEYLTDAYLFDGTLYSRLPDLPYGRSNAAIVAANNGVYHIGGGSLDPSYYNVSYLQLSPTVGKAWEPMAPLHKARSWASVAALLDPKSGRERIVVAGGMSLNPMFDPMASVEIYNPKKNEWTLFDDGEPGALPVPIGFGSGARINSTHMLVGGGVGQGTTGSEAYIFQLA